MCPSEGAPGRTRTCGLPLRRPLPHVQRFAWSPLSWLSSARSSTGDTASTGSAGVLHQLLHRARSQLTTRGLISLLAR